MLKIRHTIVGIAASAAILAAAPVLADEAKPQAQTQAQAQAKAAETEIPFASLGGISGWNADGDKGLYIQGRNGKWYYAKLLGYCPGLANAETIAFASTPMGAFDKFSSIIVHHHECQVKSLVEKERPGKKEK
jgi:hypothetical protein